MINIVVDFVLVGYFQMGAKGAAIATVSALLWGNTLQTGKDF